MALIMLSIAIAYFIHWNGEGLALQWAFLIVFGFYLLIAALLASSASARSRRSARPRRRSRRPRRPSRSSSALSRTVRSGEPARDRCGRSALALTRESAAYAAQPWVDTGRDAFAARGRLRDLLAVSA